MTLEQSLRNVLALSEAMEYSAENGMPDWNDKLVNFELAARLFIRQHGQELLERVTWQPIETVPKRKNGVTFMRLAWGPEDDKCTGDGLHCDGLFFACAGFYCIGQERAFQMREQEVFPTHWMHRSAMTKESAE